MAVPVKLQDVVEALEGAGEEHTYYFDKRTGEIVMITDQEMQAAEEDELISAYPDWQRESVLKAREIANSDERFVELPDQFEINEYKIMEDFCLAYSNRGVGEELRRLIKGSGAFRRFKNAVNSMRVDEAWYEFRQKAFEKIAIEWLEEEGIPYTRTDESENLDQEK